MKRYFKLRKCKKCGSRDISDQIRMERTYSLNGFPPHMEHIERSCKNCGFTWDELPISPCKDNVFKSERHMKRLIKKVEQS